MIIKSRLSKIIDTRSNPNPLLPLALTNTTKTNDKHDLSHAATIAHLAPQPVPMHFVQIELCNSNGRVYRYDTQIFDQQYKVDYADRDNLWLEATERERETDTRRRKNTTAEPAFTLNPSCRWSAKKLVLGLHDKYSRTHTHTDEEASFSASQTAYGLTMAE